MKILTGERVAMALGILLLSGCVRLEVATPEKPITINMNVKIEHEIQIRVDKDVEALLKKSIQSLLRNHHEKAYFRLD